MKTCRLGSSQWCTASRKPAPPSQPSSPARRAVPAERTSSSHGTRDTQPVHHSDSSGKARAGSAPATTAATDRGQGEARSRPGRLTDDSTVMTCLPRARGSPVWGIPGPPSVAPRRSQIRPSPARPRCGEIMRKKPRHRCAIFNRSYSPGKCVWLDSIENDPNRSLRSAPETRAPTPIPGYLWFLLGRYRTKVDRNAASRPGEAA